MVTVLAGDGPSSEHVVQVDYPHLLDDLKAGDRVVLGDGTITMRVVALSPEGVQAEVESGARTQGRPGVHLSCDRLALTAPTADDLVLADAVAVAGVDYIALSFVRDAKDVAELRSVVGTRSRIMAKIETASALNDLGEIAATADAVMVARGDLGIDCPLEDVPHLQKHIVRHCVEVGTPVVTATQMLESMIDAPSPTRAEVSDVANAVFDGTDAVMLSAETAIGIDPANVVATMSRIAERARPATASGQRGWVASSSVGRRTCGTGSPSRSRTLRGRRPTTSRRRRSCAAPGPGVPRGRWPGSVRRHDCSGCRPTSARWGHSRCRGASSRSRWTNPTPRTTWCGSPSRRR
jgi:pyruvate kinase